MSYRKLFCRKNAMKSATKKFFEKFSKKLLTNLSSYGIIYHVRMRNPYISPFFSSLLGWFLLSPNQTSCFRDCVFMNLPRSSADWGSFLFITDSLNVKRELAVWRALCFLIYINGFKVVVGFRGA